MREGPRPGPPQQAASPSNRSMNQDQNSILQNVLWNALTGSQAACAVGEGGVRRYGSGYPPMAAFADPAAPDLGTLARFSAPDERLFLTGVTGVRSEWWRTEIEVEVDQMVWRADRPSADPGAAAMTAADVPDMVALMDLTHPGPFGELFAPRFFGRRLDGKLVATAGERMAAGPFLEISGVCTHPEFQGLGLARGLMEAVIARTLDVGKTPFLHVLSTNQRARDLYLHMGFAAVRRYGLSVVTRLP